MLLIKPINNCRSNKNTSCDAVMPGPTVTTDEHSPDSATPTVTLRSSPFVGARSPAGTRRAASTTPSTAGGPKGVARIGLNLKRKCCCRCC